MLKFFLGIAIVAFTTLCGYLLAKKYRQRALFFKQFHVFNERFLNEIAYYKRPVREFISQYSYKGDFGELLSHFLARVEKGKDLVGFLEEDAFSFLTEEEIRLLENYFLMLGKGDSLSQRNYFSSMKAALTTYDTEAQTTCKQYGDLYVKFGFLCGLLLLILII